MKGIVLSAGLGTRLYPLTEVVCKQLLPVFDKPMVFYPLSILMLAGIRDILMIVTPRDLPLFRAILGDGNHLGISLQYATQEVPKGLPDAFVIGKDFIGDDSVMMILGDNIFYGDMFINNHVLPAIQIQKSSIFAYFVSDPERYGVVEFDRIGEIVSIEEKPRTPRSNYAVTGLYIFDKSVSKIAQDLRPSLRGETEIVDLIRHYLREKSLRVEKLARGVAWLDTGTHQSLLEASSFVQTIEKRQGQKIACLEEIAYCKGFIDLEKLDTLAKKSKGSYREYLEDFVSAQRFEYHLR